MIKTQRLRYEMFVRVRNFGTSNREVFPEASVAGQRFGQVAAVVANITAQLVRRADARAETRKVKDTTRVAVLNHLRAIASTGRRAAGGETVPHPFRMPSRRSTTAVITTARLFMEEADARKEQFVALGMPATFLADFQKAVEDLERAVEVQQDSRAARKKAQAAIETDLARGYNVIRDLDVTVANALRDDPVRLGQWQGARRVEGASSAGQPKKDGVTPAEEVLAKAS